MNAYAKSWKQHPIFRALSVGFSHPAVQMGLVRAPVDEPFRITFALDSFRSDSDRRVSHAILDILLAAHQAIQVVYLQAHPNTPLLYQSGVRYMEEPIGQEDWQDIPTSIKMGTADCEDVACWRAAELQVKFGIDAHAIWRESKRNDGSTLYHIVVQYPDGRIEDPSRILGMR